MPQSERRQVVVAIDPGRAKCGLAAVSTEEVLERAIVPTEEIASAVAQLADRHGAAVVVLGSRTGSDDVRRALAEGGQALPTETVEEHMSTLLARHRYWVENPPGCLMRLVPEGMRTPPVDIDDWAAVLLAEKYLGQ